MAFAPSTAPATPGIEVPTVTVAQIAELPMYVAPSAVQAANEQWLALTLQILGVEHRQRFDGPLDELWLHPQLLLTQTCGYPLKTRLGEQVRVLGRPCFELPDAENGRHCSLLIVRRDDPRHSLAQWRGSHGVLNSRDSNTGMNLLYRTLAPLAAPGSFFARESLSGSHRASLAQVPAGRADLAAIDSVTYAYLARHAADEVAGVRVLGRTEQSPTLPYITRVQGTDGDAVRAAMNRALAGLPQVRQVLGIVWVMPANLADYQGL